MKIILSFFKKVKKKSKNIEKNQAFIDFSYFFFENRIISKKNQKNDFFIFKEIEKEFNDSKKNILELNIGNLNNDYPKIKFKHSNNYHVTINNTQDIFLDKKKIFEIFSKMKWDLIYCSIGCDLFFNPKDLMDEIDRNLNLNGGILIETFYSNQIYINSTPFVYLNHKTLELFFNKNSGYNILQNITRNNVIGRISKYSSSQHIDKPINFALDTCFYAKKYPYENDETNSFFELKKHEVNQDIKPSLIDKKLNILIGCLFFTNRTGSELYVYELAKKLVDIGHSVSICSEIGEPLASLARKKGIKLFPLNSPPGYKLGNNEWKIESENGLIESQSNTFYKIEDTHFDILHLNHKPITEHLMRLYPETPIISTIHSEVIDLENPVLSSRIKKYIAIRPEIETHLIKNFNIPKEQIEVIYNPIDEKKFTKSTNNKQKNEKSRILFVGTIDYLRKETIIDLIRTTKNLNQELWIVGKKNEEYLDSLIINEKHVKYFPPSSEIEKYIHQCDETAGILLGRTTIEGWMCGKKGWIYNVDSTGKILNKKLHDIPNDIHKFNSTIVVSRIQKLYYDILNYN